MAFETDESVLNSEVSSYHDIRGCYKYTNESFETDENILFREASSIQRYSYRERLQ